MYKHILLITFFLFFLASIPHPSSGSLPIATGAPVGEYRQFEIIRVSPTEVYPSDVTTISITFRNVDDEKAGHAVSTVVNPDTSPLQVIGELGKFGGKLIMPHETFTVDYILNVRDNTPKGIYYLNITVLWATDRAKTVIREENLYIGIMVVENPKMIKINTVNITTIPEHVHAGDQFRVVILLQNIGNTRLTQIRAHLDAERPFSAIGSSTEQYIPQLEPDQTAEAVFNLMVDKQAMSRLYNLNLSLEYRDSTNRLQSQQGSFGIDVEEESRIYIQDVRLDPTTLNPGTEGLLMVQIANTGTNSVKNVRVTTFGGEEILTQNQNYIGIIQPGSSASETTSFGVLVDPDLAPGDYGLSIQLNYDDVSGNQLSQSNLYIVKISEPGSLIPIPDQFMSYLLITLVFLVIGYAIFLGTGYRLEKEKRKGGGS